MRTELISVKDGKFHRLANPEVERNQAWKPALTVCGRTVTPVNYFVTEADAAKYTGNRLVRYGCKHCKVGDGEGIGVPA